MNIIIKTNNQVKLLILLAFLAFVSMFTLNTSRVYASDNNFADGITVDSTGDGVDASIGNNICDDGAGNCTLRAAIEESNATAGTQTINFNISGTPDFTNGGQSGYSIKPVYGAGIPSVTDTVVINGYSQSGSLANTAVAPNPLNGRLLIEIDGSLSGSDEAFNLINNSHNSEIRGLIINNFGDNHAIKMMVDNITIQGNYIGTNYSGTAAKPNGTAIGSENLSPNNATDVLVGGLNPADRNLISGNTAGSTSTASYPGTDWVFQGNYIGVAADGLTPIDNSTPGGSGALSIDNCTGTIVGGSQDGAINVIGASLGHGIAPHEADDLTIEGNYIGLGYDGTTVLGNITPGSSGAGIALTDSDTVSIKNNRFAGWTGDGVAVNLGNSNVTVDGNNITDSGQAGINVGSANIIISNNTISNSTQDGINVFTANNTITDNTISDSTQNGISVSGTDNIITDNTISDSTQNGLALYSGATDNEVSVNTITTSTLNGISIEETDNIITSNTISDSTQNGLGLYSGATNNEVSANSITTSTQNGIRVEETDNIITGNTVSDSTQTGINVTDTDNTITGNTITNNTSAGIGIDASDNQILDNIISNNHGVTNLMLDGAGLSPIQNLTVQGNKIGTKADGTIDGSYTQNAGILLAGGVSNSLIGGTNPGDGNIIAGNNSVGIGVSGLNVTGFGTLSPTTNSILGNSIFGNDVGNIYGLPAPGLGIDNYMVNLDGSFVPQSTSEAGVTANDASDTDTGPNNYMNFPVLNSATQTDNSLALNFDLDAADSPTNQYRVEFFANDSADASGYGEGQTYLGSVTTTNGTGNTANLTLPSGTNLTGKVLSATTTAMNNATPSGFGSTSEFSAVLAAQVISLPIDAPANNNTSNNNQANSSLTNTGTKLGIAIVGGILIVIVAIRVRKFTTNSALLKK